MTSATQNGKIDQIFLLGSVFALISVGMGAFGAHALKETLLANETTQTWKTAVQYQMWHALALILCSIRRKTCKIHRLTPLAFSLGILLFSGSLYWLALGGPSWLGPITPLGGITLMLGWVLLINKALKSQN
ncbi:MAG: DUF423 domain-containing protein [Verrucomicrobiota bacterium]